MHGGLGLCLMRGCLLLSWGCLSLRQGTRARTPIVALCEMAG